VGQPFGRLIRGTAVNLPPNRRVAALWDNRDTPRSEWSISLTLAKELEAYLQRVRPRRILEVGSGFSTAVLAAYAVWNDAEVVTLEHDPEYHTRTGKGLAKLGLVDPVDLKQAHLRSQQFGSHEPYLWYDIQLDGQFDFVFVDGPPKVNGRLAVFFAVRNHLKPGWQMWVDDGLRGHEGKCVKVWGQNFPGEFGYYGLDIDGKGVFILRDAREEAVPKHLGIGVLGGGDPDWWELVKRHVGEQVLKSSHVVVTDRDAAPAPLPKFVDRRFAAGDQGVRRMLHELARRPDVLYVLYLDDRWSLQPTCDERWLRRALDILQRKSDVDQVLLRRRINAIGEASGQLFVRPFSGEPALLRAKRLKLTPRRRLLNAPRPLRTEQLFPGVFRLTGPPAGAGHRGGGRRSCDLPGGSSRGTGTGGGSG
jgi:hypothetical protein